ncbi:MAG: hypothetical protein R2860_16150 [Desulfobacterales bacterium]
MATREGFEDIFAGNCRIRHDRNYGHPLRDSEIITHVAVLHRDRQLTAMPRHRFVPTGA